MKIPDEVFIKAIREGKILPYEPELIEKLRTIHYKGFPLSILLLSKEICNKLGYEKYPNTDMLGIIKIIFSIIVFGVVFAILLNFIISSTYWFIHSRKKRK